MRQRGFSLIELMIALALGLLVVEGIYILFAAAGRVNATQTALSRLQENGRVAMNAIAEDLRSAGHLPCGSKSSPLVFTEALPNHIVGQPAEARAPAELPGDAPYPLDRSIFLGGSTCSANSCVPAVAGIPSAGLGVGDKVPGTDVLIVRYLEGEGLPLAGAGLVCGTDGKIAAIGVGRASAGGSADRFRSPHLALLAGCVQAQIFQADWQSGTVQPVAGKPGAPACPAADAQTRLFDLDEQLRTSIYYLQVVADDRQPGRRISALMRRTNGVVSEVVQGIERLDLRYSLTDATGNAHWLNADELSRHAGANGEALQCGQAAPLQPCAWKDVVAVEISMLVNTVDDVPAESSADAWDYRYSVDGDRTQRPGTVMAATGLSSGRMLRREFRTIVALREFAS